jgi:NAD(P)-dependent dehydrogenase (short-subunit alcohol dehydrogenase family)
MEIGMARFDGKHIFVTGAGSGFGRRTAERFAEEGAAEIYLVDLLQDRLDVVAEEIRKRGSNPISLCFDLADAAKCSEAMAKALSRGPLDVLICNAAEVEEKRFINIELASWKRQLAVNLTAYFILGRDAARSMVEQKSGVILFTSSIDAQGHSLGFTPYCVTKAGEVSLMKSMAVELARSGVRVNSVSPGPADTQQSTDLVGEDLMEKWRKYGFPETPLNRLVSVNDIANAFLYLASDDASFVTGHDLVVDGGHTADLYEIPYPENSEHTYV